MYCFILNAREASELFVFWIDVLNCRFVKSQLRSSAKTQPTNPAVMSAIKSIHFHKETRQSILIPGKKNGSPYVVLLMSLLQASKIRNEPLIFYGTARQDAIRAHGLISRRNSNCFHSPLKTNLDFINTFSSGHCVKC